MLRTFAAIALCAAAGCSKSDAAASASKTPPAQATATATANGSVEVGALPQDSISTKADAGRIFGDANVKLWVIMASDFQCPYCKQWHDLAFASLMNDYAKTGKVRLAFINMPLSMHPNAMPAAEAAMCASVQNKFWPMHEALFAAQDEWAPLPDPSKKFETIAGTLGLDMPQWKTCVSKHLTAALITADRDRARAGGVQSTPTFFVNGKMLLDENGQSPGIKADLRGAIEAALKTAR